MAGIMVGPALGLNKSTGLFFSFHALNIADELTALDF